MALQSVPFGPGRSNVGIYYKELESLEDFSDPEHFAKEWDGKHQASVMNSGYSTMTLQADHTIGFLFEESTYGRDYSIIYKNYSLETITDSLYVYDEEVVADDIVKDGFEEKLNAIKECVGKNVGNIKETSASAIETAGEKYLQQPSKAAYEAFNLAVQTAEQIEIESGKYYRLRNSEHKDQYLVLDVKGMSASTLNQEDNRQLFSFKKDEITGVYVLQCKENDSFIGTTPDVYGTIPVVATESAAGNFSVSSSTKGLSILTCKNGSSATYASIHLDRYGKLVPWVTSSTASQWYIEPAESIGDDIADYVTEISAIPENCVGGLSAEDKETFLQMPAETAEDYQALKSFVDAHRIAFNANRYYRLQNVMREGAIQVDSEQNKLTPEALNNGNGNMLWKIETATDGVKLYHANSNMWASEPENVSLVSEGAVYKMESWGFGQYGFSIGNDYLVQNEDHIGGNTTPVKGGDHMWYLLLAQDIELAISDVGYATINYPFAVRIPAELTAYTGTVSGEYLVLKEIEGDLIPANTPAIISGAADTYKLAILEDDTTPAVISDLKGTTLAKTINPDIKAYILGKPEKKEVGFYLLDDSDRTIGINKAYLEVSTGTYVKCFTFKSDETTGMDHVESVIEDEEFYDMQGRRVMKPVKGVYVTKNGKKVIFK